MSRFLFISAPFVAHVNPMVSIAGELTARGHDVAWVLDESLLHLLPEESKAYRLDDGAVLESVAKRALEGDLGLASAFKYLIEDVMLPLARSMQAPVEDAIAAYEPEVMLVDHHALGGALAARKNGITWATSAPSAQLYTPVLDEMARVRSWVQEQYAQVQAEAGLEAIETPDLSPDLVLLYTTPDLVGTAEYPASYRFVGASIRGRVDAPDFPWDELGKGKKVLVSLGSIMSRRGEQFFQVLRDALADTDLQVIVSAAPEQFPDPPENFIVRGWLPLLDLLPHVDALITHGGSTVNEALAYAVPMVVTPMTNDQVIYARCVAESGAGLRLRFRRLTAAELHEAVMRVIEEPAFAEAALRIQTSFARAGGTHAAADALECLAARAGEA
jgi:MGT family glycosyltransferase